MNLIDEPLPGLKLIQLKLHGDDRGFFVERYERGQFEKIGIQNIFVQDNHSRSAPGILRGLHYQLNPAQGKLVGAARGRIFDVAVDLRKGSGTYGKWFGTELSDMNGRLLWVPGGFAHGFCVIGDTPADVIYKVDCPYNPAHEGGLAWDDPEIGISWPIVNPILSKRDQSNSRLASIVPI